MPGDMEGGQYKGSGSCHSPGKDLTAWQKDSAEHSQFIKAIVCTWEVRVGDIWEWDTPVGSKWKIFTKHHQGEWIGWSSAYEACRVTTGCNSFLSLLSR